MEKEVLKKLCSDSCEVVKKVGDFIHQELGKVKAEAIEVKALNSLVSYVDKEAEKKLVESLGNLLPSSTFLTEEETIKSEKGTYQWIIDPLDGTTNFLHQLPFFSVSVALQYNDQTIIGIVYAVNQKECFYAFKDGGAFLNGKPIAVTNTTTLADSLIATGFPYYDYTTMKAYLGVLEVLMQKTRGIRRFGSAALDMAYVACGRFDGYFEYSLNAWDIAAGALIVQEAGGIVSDFKGGDNYLFGREMIASNSKITTPFFDLINMHFYPNS